MTKEALIERYVEEDPYKPGVADARLKGRGIPVWAIVGHLQTYQWNAEEVARSYDIPVEAVEAALAYYRRHTASIDARLADNAA